MRQKQKTEILNCIKSLYQAHDEIRAAGEQSDNFLVQNMLGECQEHAIQLGNAIEEIEGRTVEPVKFLEDYCECVYVVYQEMGNKGSIHKQYKRLQKSLLKVENSIKNDIRVQKEIVFFPYKSSMWDSLESVYLEAKKSRDCNVYCVPIPYFELNPDHSFGVMHYEGGQFPSNIEVTNWETYSFEDREPDVIIIHNAYDDWNLVTSVHPRFYSANLKKYTKRLIYIPYFVMNENLNADNEKEIKEVSHFCYMPGIIHADEVIVQSEKIKKIYAKVYAEVLRKQGIKRNDMAIVNKFSGLGSPKFDKVRNYNGVDEVPKEWTDILTNRGDKKIVFWNIGISEILSNRELAIDKIQYIFNYFADRTDKFILLLRPHPLLTDTMRSMCPQLLGRYCDLINNYKKGGWGIYDDTPDVDRAVGLSDFYFGGGSSVIQLFKAVQKPIFRICYGVNSLNNEYGLNADVCIVGNDFWFMPIWSNQLYCFHSDTAKTEFIQGLWQYPPKGRHLFSSILFDKEKLYFIPLDADALVVFDLKKKEYVKYIKLGRTRFRQGLIVDGQLYCIPGNNMHILQFDLQTETIRERYEVRIDGLSAEDGLCETKAAIADKRIFVPINKKNGVLVFETDSKNMRFVSMDKYMDGVCCVCVCQNGIWVLSEKMDLYSFDLNFAFRSKYLLSGLLVQHSVSGMCNYCWADECTVYAVIGEHCIKIPVMHELVLEENVEFIRKEKAYYDIGSKHMVITGDRTLEICCSDTGAWKTYQLDDFQDCKEETVKNHLSDMDFEIYETEHINLEQIAGNLEMLCRSDLGQGGDTVAKKIWEHIYTNI